MGSLWVLKQNIAAILLVVNVLPYPCVFVWLCEKLKKKILRIYAPDVIILLNGNFSSLSLLLLSFWSFLTERQQLFLIAEVKDQSSLSLSLSLTNSIFSLILLVFLSSSQPFRLYSCHCCCCCCCCCFFYYRKVNKYRSLRNKIYF